MEEGRSEYCNFSLTTIPRAFKDFKKKYQIPFGAVLSPFLAKPNEIIQIASEEKCENCENQYNYHTTLNYNKEGKIEWKCVFCGNVNIAKDPNLISTITEEITDYCDPTPVYTRSTARTIIFVIDKTISTENMKQLVETLKEAIYNLPKDTKVGFILFSTVISVYEVPKPETTYIASEIYSAEKELSKEELERIDGRITSYVAPLSSWEFFTDVLFKQIVNSANRVKNNKQLLKRGFGAAAQLAVHLAKEGEIPKGQEENAQEGLIGGKIISFMNGSSNYGIAGQEDEFSSTQHQNSSKKLNSSENQYKIEENQKYFRKLSEIARLHQISIDIFCIQLKNFNLSVLNHLTSSTGGFILLSKDFSDIQLKANLLHRLFDFFGRSCQFQLSFSHPSVEIGHLIGPIRPSADPNRFFVNSPSLLTSFSFFFKSTSPSFPLSIDFLYFQFSFFFISQNKRVKRTITKRIKISGDQEEWSKSLNEGVLSVLLAKKWVLSARKLKPTENISKIHTKLDSFIANFLRNSNASLQGHCKNLPLILFLLRRGPLLGPILQHPDDIDFARNFFIHFPFPDSFRFLVPSFFKIQSNSIIPLPLEDLALQSDSVLLMDHQTDILIWEGRQVDKESREHLLAVANRIAEERYANRFPKPYIIQFKEGTSMARWLLCRLIPSHKDPKELQTRSFPELANLSDIDYRKFMGKFLDTDDPTFYEYLSKLRK